MRKRGLPEAAPLGQRMARVGDKDAVNLVNILGCAIYLSYINPFWLVGVIKVVKGIGGSRGIGVDADVKTIRGFREF